jgi:predicted TIM-barrel fold metal-dependent hydrolase
MSADTIQQAIADSGVIDAHHHMLTHMQRRSRDVGLWSWLQSSYFAQLVTPCGLSLSLFDEKDEKALATLMDRTRATTHYQIARRGLLAAYGCDLNDRDWRKLDESIQRATNKDDWSHDFLKREMNLVDGVLDKHVGGTLVDAMTCGEHDWYRYITQMRPTRHVSGKTRLRDIDARITHASAKIDSFLYGHQTCTHDELSAFFGVPGELNELDEYLAYVDEAFKHMGADPHIVALKTAIGDVRRLMFEPVSKQRAAKVFIERTPQTVRDFEDFMMHRLCDLAAEHNLVFQFHTGMGPNGTGGYIADPDANVALLTGLILKHPDTQFDLMHGGYPHWREAAMLAARFSNVSLNLSWCSIISAGDLHHLLDSWIDQVPAHKIFWGSDCVYAEEVLGAFLLSRDVLVDVLCCKVNTGVLSAKDAADYAACVFRDNASQLFGI